MTHETWFNTPAALPYPSHRLPLSLGAQGDILALACLSLCAPFTQKPDHNRDVAQWAGQLFCMKRGAPDCFQEEAPAGSHPAVTERHLQNHDSQDDGVRLEVGVDPPTNLLPV